MLRFIYLAGGTYLVVCAAAIMARRMEGPVPRPEPHDGGSAPSGGGGAAWFASIKPYCNAVEVETAQQHRPAPSSADGPGYSAACYALAGKIDRARSVIEQLGSSRERQYAAQIVFAVGHPVADAGDDRSAGPMMELVLDYDGGNYMALYHAGMSEYALGQPDLAREHLQRFLELYGAEDGWRSNAREILGRLDRGS
jgi:tetratricopeptide (TPR) repeat protein